ncbi:hypothetical protein QQS21_003706 [Conoideocrella luteorostrata]|uniref:Nephrocystin 3-like N-terminal domain-containing protein n=1 Tax=Conoideocrella luteorostrata TaxID=1105319 RepID=A0AAJ0CSW0_9HYPO|nr:hypothetical protein QQS21_003706 [Conoideocrella luteorostrata]
MLVKDVAVRDRIAADIGGNCICFEMEAPGLMKHFLCLVIRGISDYTNSNKNDQWQRYASATTAAYAEELLAYVPVAEVQETKRALEVLQLVKSSVGFVPQIRLQTPITRGSSAVREQAHGSLKNPVFQECHVGLRRHLWLNGLAGCGKTVLSATVLDHLTNGENCLILNFFFDFSDTTKQTLDGMLRSLAYQLYQGGAGSIDCLEALFQAHQNGCNQTAVKTLVAIVHKMLTVWNISFIVLDALDESITRGKLLLWIKNMVSRPELGNVRLICENRPEPKFIRIIPSLIGEDNCLPLQQDSVNADIRSYVKSQLSQRPEFLDKHLPQDLLSRIQRKVGDGADVMFRWAFCQLDSLARCPHEAAIDKALESLPRNLEETYQRMVQGIPTELKSNAVRLL